MNNTYWDIITKKLGDDCNSGEKEKFKKLFNTDSDFKQDYNDSLKIWNTTQSLKSKTLSPLSFDEVISKIDQKVESLKGFTNDQTNDKNVVSINRRFVWITSIAASIALLISFYFITPLNTTTPHEQKLTTNFTNPKGSEIKKIQLPDGSSATLMAGSMLNWENPEAASIREVNLSGEAIFSVRKNSSKPFVVNTSSTSIRVLGTVFSVQAYSGTENTIVSVTEGSVAFNTTNEKVTLKAGQTATYNNETVLLTISNNDKSLENRLFFNNITLGSAAIILENRFGKEIIIQNNDLVKKKIYGKFDQDNLSEILQSISLALDIKYTYRDGKVYLQES